MNIDEKTVCDFLVHLGYEDIVYQPDGQATPDFLVNGEIAVEARRLNQNFVHNDEKIKGHETVAIPIKHKVKNLLNNFGPPVGKDSWFVFLYFKRPVGNWESKLTKGLKAFQQEVTRQNFYIIKDINFDIRVSRSAEPKNTMFLYGGCIDRDDNGWLLEKMEKNMRFCINEKSKKIIGVRHKYVKWWLVLVDYISYGLDDSEIIALKNKISFRHDWNRVIIVDHTNYKKWLEI
jgi:hypothetical protein